MEHDLLSFASAPRRLVSLAMDAAFPPRCAGCRVWLPSAEPGQAAPLFCAACEKRLPRLEAPLCDCCGHPDELKHPSHRCADCRQLPPAFTALRSLYDFDAGAREAVHAVKYKRTTCYVPHLAARLVALFDDHPIPQKCILVPVPLHPWRKWRRGFNQSDLLATALAAALGNSATFEPGVLHRTRWTTSQVELDEAHRTANVRGAFTADGANLRALPQRPIVLVDDVATTGATLDDCARALKAAGAAEVYAVTIARKL